MRYVKLRAMNTTADVPWFVADALLFAGCGETADGYEPAVAVAVGNAKERVRRWARRRLVWGRARVLATVAFASVLSLALLVTVPSVARAAFGLEILSDPMKWIADSFTNAIKAVYQMILEGCLADHLVPMQQSKALEAAVRLPLSTSGHMSGSIEMGNDALESAWGYLFGGGTSLYRVVNTLAESVLVIVFLVKALRVAQEPDHGQDAVPYITRISWMCVQFVLLKQIQEYAVPLSALIFNSVNDTITAAIANTAVSGAVASVDAAEMSTSLVEALWGAAVESQHFLGKVVIVGLKCLVVWACVAVLDIMATFAIVSRYLQLFVYLIFAPLFFAFAGLEETRSMFIGYLKSMLGFALSFTITAIILRLIPVVYIPNFTVSGFQQTNIIVLTVVLGQSLAHASSWAHDLIGG